MHAYVPGHDEASSESNPVKVLSERDYLPLKGTMKLSQSHARCKESFCKIGRPYFKDRGLSHTNGVDASKNE
jgi:hypothetical protein